MRTSNTPNTKLNSEKKHKKTIDENKLANGIISDRKLVYTSCVLFI